MTTPIHFFVSFWIERQPPVKEDKPLDKENIYILIEKIIKRVEHYGPPFVPASFKNTRLILFRILGQYRV